MDAVKAVSEAIVSGSPAAKYIATRQVEITPETPVDVATMKLNYLIRTAEENNDNAAAAERYFAKPWIQPRQVSEGARKQ